MSLGVALQMKARNNAWMVELAQRSGLFTWSLDRAGRKVVERSDDVVIDGYPRSANTFAMNAFVAGQTRKIRIGHHFHSPAQFALARKYGVPAMLVLREPAAATLSWVVYNEAKQDPAGALRYYVNFHRPLLRITDSFVVAPFEEVISDFGKSIERLNHRFGTQFNLFTHSKTRAAGIFEVMEERLQHREATLRKDLKMHRHYPHPEKDKEKARIATAFDHSSLRELKIEAQEQYEQLMSTL